MRKLEDILAGRIGPILGGSHLDLRVNGNAMYAAIADDGGVFTDETTEANESTADDMTLLPATPAVGDNYYFGGDEPFANLQVNISTAGVGTWTITWEYWDGAAWQSLSGVSDGTSGFTVAGSNDVTFTLPGDWQKNIVNSQGPFYYIRANVSAYTSITTQPLGQQSWIIDSDLAVNMAPEELDVITHLIFNMEFADSNVEFDVFAAEATPLTNGFFLQYNGQSIHSNEPITTNGKFFHQGFDVSINSDAAGTPNNILVATIGLQKSLTPWGLKMWDNDLNTFGVLIRDDMLDLASLTVLELSIHGYNFPE